MDSEELYGIGDVARRTGLSVSAIRFYSDEGIVPPTAVNGAGHRQYDLRGVAQLELIRTLRDLGTGLEEIRRLLQGETTLRYLLAEHLELVERQERDLRARRAVLRALNKQNAPADRAVLMRKIVVMPDEERERLVDDFWNDVGAGLTDGFVERLRSLRPALPDDPEVEQLEAWIELADLLRDDDFRRAVRGYLRDRYASPPGLLMTADPVQHFIHDGGTGLMEAIMAAHRSGLPADNPHALHLLDRFLQASAEAVGLPTAPDRRERLAAAYEMLGTLDHDPRTMDPEYDATHGRYQTLVMTINKKPLTPTVSHTVDMAALTTWMAQVLRTPSTPLTPDAAGPS
jgi:DNA-binding transcriptional MerR regulator